MSPTSLNAFSYEWGCRGIAYLWVGFERFVQLPVEEADLCFVLCDTSAEGLMRLERPTEADVHQEFGIVVEYPVVVIKVDNKICCLGRHSAQLLELAYRRVDIPLPHVPLYITSSRLFERRQPCHG